jgi:hypothetical protein
MVQDGEKDVNSGKHDRGHFDHEIVTYIERGLENSKEAYWIIHSLFDSNMDKSEVR